MCMLPQLHFESEGIKKNVDNANAGGILVGVSDDGKCLRTAVNSRGEKYLSHPDTGLVFENHYLCDVGEIKKKVLMIHESLPQSLCFLSCDVAVDKNDNVVIIEINTFGQSSWIPQIANGKGLFGSNTKQILDIYKNIM